jgi:cell division protein FtsW
VKNGKSRLSKQTKSIDRRLFFLVIAFVVVGIIAVADVSAPQALNTYGDKFYFLKLQLEWAGLGIIAFFIASKIKYTFWEKVATPLFLVAVILLLVVLLPHFSSVALGARRWISVGPFSFQPTEIVKFAVCIYIAKVASKGKGALSYFIPLAVIAALIMFQPDLGTTLVVLVIGLSQIFVSDVNLLYLGASLGLGAVITFILVLFSPYRKERLLTFLKLTEDPLGKSYHITQVLLALGSGGIFGVGLGASRQKYLFLPEASTDSIFAVLAEELGLVGAIVIVALFGYFVLRGLTIARDAPDTFSKVLATGIAAWVGGQAFLNIASMVSLVPLTGVPLPFISYGGSSLVMILTACGILLNISKYVTEERK